MLFPGIGVTLPYIGFNANFCLPRRFKFGEVYPVFWIKHFYVANRDSGPSHPFSLTVHHSCPRSPPPHVPFSLLQNVLQFTEEVLYIHTRDLFSTCIYQDYFSIQLITPSLSLLG